MMNNIIKILITGDTHLGGGRVKDLALRRSKRELFGNFINTIQEADIAVTNLESTLVDNAAPILKIGPNLKSPVQSLAVLKEAGFDLLTLANNHIMDYGTEGLASTLITCSKAGLEVVGAGKNKKKAQQPFIRKLHGISVGIINIAENEFGTTHNGSPGAHALNPVQNYYQIKELCNVADYVIVIVHGGHENYRFPSPRMKETYRFFSDAGANAVVGHHPHCYSGYEVYKDAPIFYSIGNFLFDKQGSGSTAWNEGYMVGLEISNNGLNFNIIPYVQNDENAGLRTLSKEEKLQFEENISQLNEVISNDEELERRFVQFCESSRKLYSAYLEPHAIKSLHALRNRKLFPSLLSKRKKRLLLNLTRCEAHMDILQKILTR